MKSLERWLESQEAKDTEVVVSFGAGDPRSTMAARIPWANMEVCNITYGVREGACQIERNLSYVCQTCHGLEARDDTTSLDRYTASQRRGASDDVNLLLP
jgi:hypothetical protein